MKSLRLSRPHAIMMVGLPGSGKSFFASQFAKTFNAPYIDSLTIEQYSKDALSAGQVITIVMNEIAKTSQTFVFEGNADTRARRTEFARWARSNGYQPLFIWTQVDAATSRDRTAKAKTMTQEEYASAVRSFSPPHPSERPVVISGKHTYATQAKVVLHHLTKEARPSVAPAEQLGTTQPTRPHTTGRTIIIR